MSDTLLLSERSDIGLKIEVAVRIGMRTSPNCFEQCYKTAKPQAALRQRSMGERLVVPVHSFHASEHDFLLVHELAFSNLFEIVFSSVKLKRSAMDRTPFVLFNCC